MDDAAELAIGDSELGLGLGPVEPGLAQLVDLPGQFLVRFGAGVLSLTGWSRGARLGLE